jgi:hypothetical protein
MESDHSEQIEATENPETFDGSGRVPQELFTPQMLRLGTSEWCIIENSTFVRECFEKFSTNQKFTNEQRK